MRHLKTLLLFLSANLLCVSHATGQNPVIRDQFTADPSARVFNGRVYLYPSHDILAEEGRGRPGWFCMEDYHVFSSTDLTRWTDHGVIVSQDNVPWVDSTSFSLWAPDCIDRDGRYYFYFPANARSASGRRFGIGVAVSDDPAGPFTPQSEPIANVHGIDPCPFIDRDGQAYLYYSMGKIFAARLKENMLELDSEPQVIGNLPGQGLIEGPYVFERNGIYYMTYPHVQDKIERLEYAMAGHPMGPFEVKGVLMDESPMGCWTNHHSVIEFNNQWYLFYHDNELSPKFDKNRTVKIDSLFFNDDGTIRKVTPTLRGVGVTGTLDPIEIDRYSRKSETGVSVAFLDTLQPFNGWKAILGEQDAWISYNAVDFAAVQMHSVQVKAQSPQGATLQIRIDRSGGTLLAEVTIPSGDDWKTLDLPLLDSPSGIHDLVVVLKDNPPVEIDWIRFQEHH